MLIVQLCLCTSVILVYSRRVESLKGPIQWKGVWGGFPQVISDMKGMRQVPLCIPNNTAMQIERT